MEFNFESRSLSHDLEDFLKLALFPKRLQFISVVNKNRV